MAKNEKIIKFLIAYMGHKKIAPYIDIISDMDICPLGVNYCVLYQSKGYFEGG